MNNNQLISVSIATYNEESNISRCLDSVKDLAHEIVIVDGQSSDKTVLIAKKYKIVKVITTTNKPNFHINKQIGIDACTNDWVLSLDADEVVSPALATEIKHFLQLSAPEMEKEQHKIMSNRLFTRHQQLLENRDGKYGQYNQDYTAFFVPRLNYFLGKYLRYGGVYPDGVIRLFNKKYSRQPAKNVHEQISTDGKVGWLSSDLYHYADPTFSRYLLRNNRYTSNIATELQDTKLPINIFSFLTYFIFKPFYWFFLTYFRHKGFYDGFAGFVFSWFSSLRFAIAYVKYYELSITSQKITLKKDWD